MPPLLTLNRASGTFSHIPKIEASGGGLLAAPILPSYSVYVPTKIVMLARMQEPQVKEVLCEVPMRSPLTRFGHASSSHSVPLCSRSAQYGLTDLMNTLLLAIERHKYCLG